CFPDLFETRAASRERSTLTNVRFPLREVVVTRDDTPTLDTARSVKSRLEVPVDREGELVGPPALAVVLEFRIEREALPVDAVSRPRHGTDPQEGIPQAKGRVVEQRQTVDAGNHFQQVQVHEY